MIKVLEHNTFPTVIHGNGTSKNETVFTKLKEKQFQKSRTDQTTSFKDVTFVSWKGGRLSNTKTLLEQSAEQYGFSVLNLPWLPEGGFWKETQQKITETLKAIKTGRISTEYTFWLDNSDVLFIKNPEAVVDIFKSEYEQKDISFIWNAERNNFPTPYHAKWDGSNISNEVKNLLLEVIEEDEKSTSTFKYMNSGAGFGKTVTLLNMLEYASSLIQNSRLTDQALMRIAQMKLKDTVHVDRECKVFLACWGLNEQDIEFI